MSNVSGGPYDGDLTIGKAAAHAARYVTEHQVGVVGRGRCWEVLLGPSDPPTWDTCTEWGRSSTPDGAWRWALAALLDDTPAGTDPVTPQLAAS